MQAGHRTSEGGDKEGSSLWNWRVEWAGSLHTALDSLSGSAFTVFLVEASLPTRLNGSCITWPMSAHQVTHQEPAILQIARHSFEDKDVLGEPYISLIERVLAAGGAGSRHLREQSTGNARLLRPSETVSSSDTESYCLLSPPSLLPRSSLLTGSQYCPCMLCCQCLSVDSSSAAGWFGLVGA